MSISKHPLFLEHAAVYPWDRDVFEVLPWLDRLSPKRVLSLGCNDEPFAEYYARVADYSVGFDLRTFNETSFPIYGVGKQSYEHRVEDWIAAFPLLPSGVVPASFDLVLAISSIEHFGLSEFGGRQSPSGDSEALELAYDALAVGGHCVVVVPTGSEWFECPHWRRYPTFMLEEKIIRRFTALERKVFWTAPAGLKREDHPEAALSYYAEGADLSVALLMRKDK